MRSLVRLLAGVAAVALALALVWPIWTQPGRWQWDFKAYYLAASAHAIGLDPYDNEALAQLSGVPHALPFVYPPHVLWLMRPFTSLPYDSAARAYLALKTAAGVGLIALLARAFLADGRDTLFWVFSLAAFKGALWLDMLAGNVVVLEQLALWGAFYFFVRDRLAAFCSLVLVAASFKLVPALFLSLLLFVEHPHRRRYFTISCAGLGLFLLAQTAIAPDAMHGFLRNASSINERGFQYNPSLLALVQEGIAALSRRIVITEAVADVTLFQGLVSWLLYGTLVTALVAASSRSWRRARLTGEWGRLVLVCLACFVLALSLPRFKSYTFIQVLFPSYLLLAHIRRTRRVLFALLFVLAVLSNGSPLARAGWPGSLVGSAVAYFWAYYPLLLSAGAWGLCLGLFLVRVPEAAQGHERARSAADVSREGLHGRP
jgi:hypothetical protein